MDLFISWSGQRSRAVAAALRDWIPQVLQAVRPWMSEEDIGKGARGLDEIAQQLEKSKAGIICLTPENLGSTWIAFEAGALSKAVGKPCIIPYLFEIEKTQLTGPLSQFQYAVAEKDDTRKALCRLNDELRDQALPKDRFEAAFEMWWVKLDEALRRVPPDETKPRPREERDLLEEILELIRGISWRANDETTGRVRTQRGRAPELNIVERIGPNLEELGTCSTCGAEKSWPKTGGKCKACGAYIYG